VLLAALAACAFGALVAGSAAGATLKEHGATEGFLAIYGKPGSNGATTIPVGGGLGRNFGFGENMLFRACETCVAAVGGPPVGKTLSITLNNAAKTKEEAKDSFIGGTLMSNTTGADKPLSFAVQFTDFQNGTLAGYSDTSDRPWIGEVCPPASTTCKTDPSFTGPAGGVKIEDVSFNLNPGTVVQGTVWGKWINSPAAGSPPCIKLESRPTGSTASQNLIVTQSALEGIGVVVGNAAETVAGEVCLISANNNWYKIKSGEEKTPLIEIENA
jgi:hypothetical protein